MASAQTWDLRWMDELKAQHKQVFDLGEVDLVADARPLRFPRNYLDAFRDVYALEFPDVKTIVGISGRAFPINASDRLWEKYALGERSKIIDPVTMKPAVRNIFMDEPYRVESGRSPGAGARHGAGPRPGTGRHIREDLRGQRAGVECDPS